MSKHEKLLKAIAFKGGTVLKKIYFKDYRFSEDLDFTLLNNEITDEQIYDGFKETFELVKEEANIPLEIIDNNKYKDGGINFYISYIGPLGGKSRNKRVKVDISRSELLVFDAVMKNVLKDYSDLEEYQLLCYSLEEMLIEKMRSVMQRMQARDFYDLWYLLEQHEIEVSYHACKFKIKCDRKGLKSEDFLAKLTERLPQYKKRWQTSLKEQIKDLPLFEKVESEVMRYVKKLKY